MKNVTVHLTVARSDEDPRLGPNERQRGKFTALVSRTRDAYGVREYGSSEAIAAQRAVRELVERGLDAPPRETAA